MALFIPVSNNHTLTFDQLTLTRLFWDLPLGKSDPQHLLQLLSSLLHLKQTTNNVHMDNNKCESRP